MNEEEPKKKPPRGPLFWLDNLLKKYIPNFNARAVIYLSIIFAIVIYAQIWNFGSHQKIKPPEKTKETVIADQTYWDSYEYTDKIKNQTVESFTNELQNWLDGKDQELVKRKFEDILFINSALTLGTGGDLTEVVPQSFAYLENIARGRYQYAQKNGFLSDTPTLVKLGTIVCNLDPNTEQLTGIELYDWRYASMTKISTFMSTKPDWKMTVGDKILDVSDPRIEDKAILKYKNANNQPAGLFSFLIFHNPKNNSIVLADSETLEMNGVDAKLTLSRITTHWNKNPKIYFAYGYEGCKQMSTTTPIIIPYGQSN
ncbi:MAG: hypothetical protein UV20_C0004G0126 [Candidatus Magasanikbacteria bacterium GW2011_GWA2_42_32]|uniref:Uncharacterized protein n=1 Tax=Candidatus Magasanikbacteria bacterium GW2011_GWA2_42_32 TaxID=1619039 RepID=A0A0G1A7L3_9BACT|nr:MAG: hypothetical protein UV20_C0004G0126 [Candidatus Magasanikbacteria bacterium GW2011_GWA2_42_32]OGH85854.1 MAG: hypothetical protein A2294_04015 [Candidatus Magasanikbacteria bacterium RIFOXYB2_FULL_38_10]